MKWITRERPKVDRIACPWLIRRFIDPEAVFLFVPFDQVHTLAVTESAIPFDVPGVKFSHDGPYCSFDAFLKEYKLDEPALRRMAVIVRGADTDQHQLAPEVAGWWALSSGLSYTIKDDQELLSVGLILYDALYNWARFLQHETHLQQPNESMLWKLYSSLLEKNNRKKKHTPQWVQELRTILQDHIDTALSLKEVSQSLDLHPSYISREFPAYFNNLSFGDYLRQQRIEKAKELMLEQAYSLTDITYLTGFSDQSHFTRIFKKVTGVNPLQY
ncbi:chromate resistance protein ChrB domain-containing protein [Flavihumibacter sp. CACIAM 22H1]|uniref:chromate resistance protein ChrB domain-containing protein n=1 Tax=Flavihumibacter sp. CACIAM 22H1 TaxID=1812911 RepID=UPI0007A8E6F5|nr:chromate resistance protein ChrB domain-containing protein [Flavihumibacter sp. CACIAM 22H1]KYP15493.1 MAG: AraC family transcriptional regulator [Flavihumibacter sp. CACIAM 22H1]